MLRVDQSRFLNLTQARSGRFRVLVCMVFLMLSACKAVTVSSSETPATPSSKPNPSLNPSPIPNSNPNPSATPVSIGKGLLFYDDAEAAGRPGNFIQHDIQPPTQWAARVGLSIIGSITQSSKYARRGRFSYQHDLVDSTGNDWTYMKAELAWNFLPAGSPLGTVGNTTAYSRKPLNLRWAAASILIPAENKDFNTITSLGFNTKSVPDDYPTPSYLAMDQGRYQFFVTNVRSDGSTVISKYDLGPVVRDQWEDWVMHRNFSGSSDGFVEVYKNGQLMFRNTGPNWKADAQHSKEPYIQMGLYKWAFRDGWTPKPDVNRVVLYMDEVRFATGEATLSDFILSK